MFRIIRDPNISLERFKHAYRDADVLLIDDIQFLAGKERIQEEFFHTFNSLYDTHKQIIISADCPPREIPTIEERLHSRFEWGLIADIQPPDLETKIAILQKKAESDRFNLPDEVAEYIARAIKSNVRELEGALTRLMAYASLTGAIVSLTTAQQVLRNIIASQEKRVTIDLIQKRVSEHFNLREQDLKVRSNTRAIAFPRQVAMYIVKQLTTASLPEIGRQFGGKHHTTVLHSINKIEELRRADKDLNRTINKLMDQLNLVVATNRPPIRNFMDGTLPDLTALIIDARTTVNKATAVLDSLERNPTRFIFGNRMGQGVELK